MSNKDPRRGGDFTISAPVTGSAIANNSTMKNITITPPGEVGSASLDDLRKAVASLRAEVEALGGSEPANTNVRYEIRQLEEELGKENPDGETVRIGGNRLQKMVDSLPHVASIAQITDRILTLIPTLFGGN